MCTTHDNLKVNFKVKQLQHCKKPVLFYGYSVIRFSNSLGRHSRRFGKWSAYTRPVAGSIVILMGIAIASGTMTRLFSIMFELFPSLATLE